MSMSLKSFIESNFNTEMCIRSKDKGLTEKERLVIYNRLGLYGYPKTLEEIGLILGNITRERVRQIEQRVYQKIRSAIDGGIIVDSNIAPIMSLASEASFLDDISLSDSEYPGKIFIKIISNAYEDKIVIIKHIAYQDKELLSTKEMNLRPKLDLLMKYLLNVTDLQDIEYLSKRFDIKRSLILKIKGLVAQDNKVAIESNRTIFYHKGTMSRVLQILQENRRPMKLKEIASKGNLSLNQVRGSILRVPGILNVGLSTYALKEWGYIEGWASDIAYHYLKEAGEPMTTRNIINLVLKQKRIKATSAYVAIAKDPRIVLLDSGHWALKNWGYENIKEKKSGPVKYNIKGDFAIENILRNNTEPLSIKQIVQLIIDTYGDQVSHDESLYYSVLNNWVKEGKLTKIKRGMYSYYMVNPK